MTTDARYHYYEPSRGHRLPHDPLNAIVGPRPIGWISSQGQNGIVNLAPYSFFNAFNYEPPIIGFSSVGPKDTLRNVQETGEFVWNLATRKIADSMNASSASVPYESDEFLLAGLTPLPSRMVAPPRVAESPVNFECKVVDVLQLKDRHGVALQTWLVLGEVVAVHILKSLLADGIFNTFGAGIILRAGGPIGICADPAGEPLRHDATRVTMIEDGCRRRHPGTPARLRLKQHRP